MRRSASLLPSCLLALITGIVLLTVGQSPLIPSVEGTLGSGAGEVSAAATTDPIRIEQVARSRLPAQCEDERESTGRRDDVMVCPLVDLLLLAAPTAAGASLVAERLTYTPGATRSVRRRTQIRVVSLEAGSLDARLDGVAFLDRRWPAGSDLAAVPNRVEGVVELHPGDLLAVPAEAAFTARNPGKLPAISLEVSVQLAVPLTPMTDRIGSAPGTDGVRSERLAAGIATAPGISAVIALGRVILSPGKSIVVDRSAGPALFVVERGRFATIREGPEVERAPGEAELVPQAGLTTIHSTGEAPLVLLILTITPAESESDSSVQ